MYENFLTGLNRGWKKEILSYEKKRNDIINRSRKKIHRVQKICYIYKRRFSTDDTTPFYYHIANF